MTDQTIPEEFVNERTRQVEEKGYHPDLDVGSSDKLLTAAACYARVAKNLDAGFYYTRPGTSEPYISVPANWPWHERFWKPGTSQRMREKAGALTLAALDAQIAEYAKSKS